MGKKIDYQLIHCPDCGGENLHHFDVHVYFRKCEDGRGSIAQIDKRGVFVDYDADMETNPSDRRDGIRVWLSCENCTAHIELTLVQHKGCTYLSTKNYLE